MRAAALIACAGALTLAVAGLVTLVADDPAPPLTPPAIELTVRPAGEAARPERSRHGREGVAPQRERPARSPAPPSSDPVSAFAPPDRDDDDRDDPFDDAEGRGGDSGDDDHDGDGD